MKKTILAALLACLLLLTACQSQGTQESKTPTPTPTQDQTAETPPVSPEPETSAMPNDENTVFPQFLKDFTFSLADTLVPEGGILRFITYQFTQEDRDNLKAAIDMDSWWVATDIPAMGLEGDDTLYDDEGHTLILAPWDDEKCLILAKHGEEVYLYHAPLSVLEAFESFMAGKAFLPDFIRSFEMDQIEIDRTPYEDKEGYKDFDVYLLDDTQQLAFFHALDPDSWAVARGDELAVMYAAALTALDREGNKLILAPWDEEKCLVNCFFADGWSTVRYWAPASVLGDALTFVDGLTSLGTIDNEAAWYYDLFHVDRGFNALLAFSDTPMSGPITDDQIAAYVISVLGYKGLYSWETGIAPEMVNEMTRKHFGRIMNSFDTGVSVTLPSGNMTATGWDVMGSCHMVLTDTPDMDEYGNITGTFLLYQIDESTWIDGLMAPTFLNHAREHMLTGNDSEYDPPIKLSVTFRIESEEVYGVQKEYLVYDAVRRMD